MFDVRAGLAIERDHGPTVLQGFRVL
jgi:hypothetical protein